jgi:hypothetical protein
LKRPPFRDAWSGLKHDVFGDQPGQARLQQIAAALRTSRDAGEASSAAYHEAQLSKARAIRDRLKAAERLCSLGYRAYKDADLLFFNEAADQFSFFKDGWRIRVAHARATYTEPQAKEAIDHVRSFSETLAGVAICRLVLGIVSPRIQPQP